jgi:DNA polymerase delta subunit 2
VRATRPLTVSLSGCYPFQEKDQFVIEECPHVYFVGNQPRFDTTTIAGPAGQQVRIIAIPKFHETGQIVLLDTESLEVELVQIDLHDVMDNDGMR